VIAFAKQRADACSSFTASLGGGISFATSLFFRDQANTTLFAGPKSLTKYAISHLLGTFGYIMGGNVSQIRSTWNSDEGQRQRIR